MSSRPLTLAVLSVATMLAATNAAAQGSLELGAFGTYTRFDSTLGLREQAGGGGRLTLYSGSGWSTFGLELEGGIAMSAAGPQAVRYIPARARLLYAAPIAGPASLVIGGGGVRNDYHDGTASISEWGYTGLVGLRFQMGTFLTLRVDGIMDYMANPINESPPDVERTTNQSVQAGLSFPLWRDKPLMPRVAERREPPPPQPQPQAQPQIIIAQAPPPASPTPAPSRNQAEADADRDGVADSRDMCSNTPAGASVDAQGCPVYRDTDGDGVIDLRDACPATPAGAEVDGRGCPAGKDSDGDGVPDVSDRCPNTPAGQPVNAVGCHVVVKQDVDSDGDGVPDSRDKCPNTAAGTPADASGCPILFKANDRTVTLRGVNFAPWKDDITPTSARILDEVARQLIEAPTINVEVAGHTSGAGDRTANIKLSLARAESVRAYLIMKGVAPERLVARGYGPDQPVATNSTDAGRAMNRRVELRRID